MKVSTALLIVTAIYGALFLYFRAEYPMPPEAPTPRTPAESTQP